MVAAIQIGSLETQIEATHELIAANTDMLKILRYQFAKGYASRLDLAAQQSQLAQVSRHPAALAQAARPSNATSAGGPGRPVSQPGARRQIRALASLQLPQDLPVSLPSVLVAQRPDVLQAEANMHAASAQIGIAIANRLPNIELTANAGSTALAIGQVFGPGTGFLEYRRARWPPRFSTAARCCIRNARRKRRLCAGRRAISQHGADRLPECRRHIGRAGAGRRGLEGGGSRRWRLPR